MCDIYRNNAYHLRIEQNERIVKNSEIDPVPGSLAYLRLLRASPCECVRDLQPIRSLPPYEARVPTGFEHSTES